MIPYWYFPTYTILGITFQTWGTFVALGILTAVLLSRKKLIACGLKSSQVWDLAFWIVVGAFVGARIAHVFFYDWNYYAQHLVEIVEIWRPGFSTFGGFVGGALAAVLFFKKHPQKNFLAISDAVLWGLPLGWAIGRIGCFLIHDHPGTLTHFLLGVRYPDGVRHDLGLYDLLLALGIFLGLLIFRKPLARRPGGITSFAIICYGVGRFFLDFLRTIDVRYLGLTPAQYGSALLVGVGIVLLARKKSA